MAKQPIHGLEVTKGSFKAVGKVSGTTKDKFFSDKPTKTGKGRRTINFGLKIDNEGRTVYETIDSFEGKEVFAYRKADKKKGIEGKTLRIPFAERDNQLDEGFNPIGINVGLEQYVDEKGTVKNKTKHIYEFDTPEYLRDNFKEDMCVFTRGNLEFGSYTNSSTGDNIKTTKFKPTQISGLSKELDFDNEEYKAVNDFEQVIIFIRAELDDSDKNDPKGIIEAKVVNYNSIEDVDFVVRNKKLFSTLKKNLKPYHAIRVYGKINNILEKEEIVDDGWGDADSFNPVGNTFTRELLITGADPSSITTDLYTKASIEEGMQKLNATKKVTEQFDGKKDSNDWGVEDKEDDDFEEGWD